MMNATKVGIGFKAIFALILIVILMLVGAMSYLFAMDAKSNRLTIGEIKEPIVSVEWHDYVEAQDGRCVINKIAWNSTTVSVQKGESSIELKTYSANKLNEASEPYAYISTEYSEDYVKEVIEGTMLSFTGQNTVSPVPDNFHVLWVERGTDTSQAGYVNYIFHGGWTTTEVPVSALENIAAYQPYEPAREGLAFTGWSKPALVSAAEGNELYRTDAGWVEKESEREVRMLWRDGQASGDVARFVRVNYNTASMTMTKADGTVKDFDIYSVGNDGTTDAPDIYCFFWDGYTESELQAELNGAQAEFENLLVPADAGYVINVYRDYGSGEMPTKNGKTYLKYRIRLTVWPETTILESQMGDLRSVAPYTPVRDGYRFTGWSAPEQIGEDYYQTFAQWERESDGGEGTGRSYAAVYGNILVFGKRTGEIPSDYQGIPLIESWWDVEDGSYVKASDVPWDQYRYDITEVEMRSIISPVNTNYWFALMPANKMDLTNLDMSRCTSAMSMFAGNDKVETLDLRSWNTSGIRDMANMFKSCTALETIYVSNRWSVEGVGADVANDMFLDCKALVGGNGYTYRADFVGTKAAVIDTDMSPGYLTLAPDEAYAALYADGTLAFGRGDEAPQVRNGADLVGAWFGIENDTYTADTVPWRNYVWNVTKVRFDSSVSPVSCAYWFNAMRYLTDVDLTGLDMGQTESAQSMFANCAAMTAVDMSVVDLSHVRYFASMFYGCTELTVMDLSTNNMDSAEGIGQFFYGDAKLHTVKWPVNWDTTHLLRMNDTFRDCASLTELDLSMMETPNLIRINGCFYGCTNLKTIYATDDFVTDNVIEYLHIFNNCTSLVGQMGTKWQNSWDGDGLKYACIDRDGQPGMFTEKSKPVDPDPVDPTPGEDDSKYPDDRVGHIMETMTLKEKVCQMFCVYPENLTADVGAPTLTVMGDAQKANLQEYPFGGICAFLPNIQTEMQAKKMIEDMQAASKIPMLTGIDEEGGRVQRIGGTTYDGATRGAGIGYQINAMQTYENDGPTVAFENAVKLADNCNRLGFNWDFAPVADVNSNPANTIIGARAYSSDYNKAAELISKAIEGFASKNVLTSIKHFPGHGDTSTDTHLGAAQVDKTKEELLQEDLIPFIAGIEAGADSVMVGHLTVPAMDPDKIATVSKPILTDFLRGELGFEGVITTDGMQMGALTNVYGKTQTGYVNATLACLEAGVDVFLLPGYPRAGVDEICKRVEAGTISEDRIDESVRRILLMKEKIGLLDEFE